MQAYLSSLSHKFRIMLLFMISKLFQGPHMRDFYKSGGGVIIVLILSGQDFRWHSDAMVLCKCNISVIQRPEWGGVVYSWYSVLLTVSHLFFHFLLVDSRVLFYRDNFTICFLITKLLASVDHLQANIKVLFPPAIDKTNTNFKFCSKIKGK